MSAVTQDQGQSGGSARGTPAGCAPTFWCCPHLPSCLICPQRDTLLQEAATKCHRPLLGEWSTLHSHPGWLQEAASTARSSHRSSFLEQLLDPTWGMGWGRQVSLSPHHTVWGIYTPCPPWSTTAQDKWCIIMFCCIAHLSWGLSPPLQECQWRSNLFPKLICSLWVECWGCFIFSLPKKIELLSENKSLSLFSPVGSHSFAQASIP